MNLIILALFLFPSFRVNFTNVSEQVYRYMSCDTSILQMDSFREKALIDTTLHFNNVKEIAKYKHQKDSVFRAFIPNSKTQKNIKEKLSYDNSIRFAKLFYKYLIGCDKNNIENFYFFNVIAGDYGLFSQNQLLSLYNLFPEKFKNSKKGKIYLDKINSRPDNIGHSILGAGNISFETVGGDLTQLQKLIDHNHQFYIILFTASWCAPCRYYTNVFRNDLEKMNNNQVEIFSISIDKFRPQWLEYLKKEGYTWKNYRTINSWDSKIMNYLHLETIPHYLLLDKDGLILDEQTGYKMKQIIDRIKQNP